MKRMPRTDLFRLCGASILTFAIPLAACNDDGQLALVHPVIVLEPEAPAELAFGEVVLERTSATPIVITVRNRGDGRLDIESVLVEGVHADQFLVSSKPTTLNPGRASEIWVRFEPTRTIAETKAELVILSNDRNRPRVVYTLMGSAREACSISVSPTHQKFLLGEVRDVTIQVHSEYECKLVRMFTDRSMFTIQNDPELPVTIPAKSNLTLKIQHTGTTNQPGVPIREFRIKESEGTESVATFEGEPPVFGCLSIFPPRILFPNTNLGETRRESATITNSCSREAAVTSAAVGTGFYFFAIAQEEYPKVVPPLGSVEVNVIYTPFSPVGDRGRLTINTNDSANPRFSLELYGQANVPRIETFPRALDFGTVVFKNPQGVTGRSECASQTRYAQVYSTGDADLIVNRLEMDPTGDDLFMITGVQIDGQPIIDINQDLTVPPDVEMRITLQFFPTSEVPPEHQSTLLIHHNAENSPSRVVLLGNGTDDGATTDIFTQLEGPKVDILWVIDDSCSMYDEQARLIDNLSQFVADADSNNADYQMAVTVTDSRSSRAGKFERCNPHPSIIGTNYADTETREEAFACMFDVGTNGQGAYEAGLGAAMRALERSIDPASDPNTNPNHGFVRPDATLAVVVMSDEDDQSAESDPVLRDFFYSVKGAHRPDRVAVHAIAGPVSEPCYTGPRNSAPGYRYHWMTQQTNGIFYNICLEDWQPVLQSLGLNVFTPTDEWDLSQAADPGSIQVEVDGTPMQRSSTDGYMYNPTGNSVKFNGPAVPAPGSQITVDYTGLCRP